MVQAAALMQQRQLLTVPVMFMLPGLAQASDRVNDYATIKYNSSGVLQWTARYNGSVNSHDEAFDIAIDNSGNVYVTGTSRVGADEYYTDYVTIKYNSSGVQQWASSYNGIANGQDKGLAIALDDQGNVYVTGQSGHPALNANIGTIKYNSAGVQQWAIEYDATTNWDTGLDIAVDASSNVYVTGFHSTNGDPYLDYVTLKYNSQGVQQWLAGYNGTGSNSDESVSICLDASGNVYITGFKLGTVYDIATIKYNSAGAQQWVQRYSSSSPSIDVPNSMEVDQGGNVYITGAISFDFGTLKYNTSGALQWITRYDFNGNFDVANSIAIDGLGNSYVTGFSATSSSESTRDYATLKYNPGGVQQWVERYNGSANNRDEANAIALIIRKCLRYRFCDRKCRLR
jgi:hypothetical protein